MDLKFKIPLILCVVSLILFLLRTGYLIDRHNVELIYNVCIEYGCSENECRLVSNHSETQFDIKCPHGHLKSN